MEMEAVRTTEMRAFQSYFWLGNVRELRMCSNVTWLFVVASALFVVLAEVPFSVVSKDLLKAPGPILF
jgi:DNA-binding NtrC family response regulator